MIQKRQAIETPLKSTSPRVALVCDWLTTPGGAEKVLLELHQMYPDAPIYTSQYRPKKITWFKDATVKTGWLQIFPSFLRKFLGPLRQLYFSHLDLSSYDLVISVTGAEAKSVRTTAKSLRRHKQAFSGAKTKSTCTISESTKNNPIPPSYHTYDKKSRAKAFHLCYCHVPTQYYWQFYDRYMKNPGFGILNPIVRLGLKLLVKPLRRADFRAAERVDQFVTISHYSADLIREYYNRTATVIAPPVDVAKFSKFSTDFSTATPYFVISCRQVAWKRVDLAIQACLEAKQPLYVIGDGPEHHRLEKLAHSSELINFRPWLEARELADYLGHASAYIFPSLEPFGIAAVEALAAGCPVIAYAKGGSGDFVTAGENGLFFSEQTVPALVSALSEFDASTFDKKAIQKSAAKFSPAIFRDKITQLVSKSLDRELS